MGTRISIGKEPMLSGMKIGPQTIRTFPQREFASFALFRLAGPDIHEMFYDHRNI